jgi:hypothetical protein
MGNIVASAWFHVAVVPLGLLLVGVFAKRLGRRDGDDSPRRNDWAVGTTVLLMLLGTVLGDIRTSQGGQISESVTWLIGVLFTAFLSIDHDRFRSWKRDHPGNPLRDKRMFIGVITAVPTLLAISLASYSYHS